MVKLFGNKKKTTAPEAVIKDEQFGVLLRPLITEKATMRSQFNQVGFWVAPSATKTQIKEAVEALFKVKVLSVNTINLPGKKKVFRGYLGQRSGSKKAFVRLEEGQTIDITSGVA